MMLPLKLAKKMYFILNSSQDGIIIVYLSLHVSMSHYGPGMHVYFVVPYDGIVNVRSHSLSDHYVYDNRATCLISTYLFLPVVPSPHMPFLDQPVHAQSAQIIAYLCVSLLML